MESSGPSGKTYEPPRNRWAEIIGATIALLTLTIPVVVIGLYSQPNNNILDSLPKTTYSLPRHDN